MSGPYEDRLPEDLELIASKLRQQRADADPLRLDRIKRRAMTQFSSTSLRRTSMRSRLATLMTILAILGVAAGAVAIAQIGTHPNPQGGAADKQYHKCGKHHNQPCCGKHHNQPCCGKHHNQTCCDKDNDRTTKDNDDKEGKGDPRSGCHKPPPKKCDTDNDKARGNNHKDDKKGHKDPTEVCDRK